MSLTSSLHNAARGLDFASRRAETLAGNVAGADTPGYLRREALPNARDAGGVQRMRDPALAAQRRDAEADVAATGVDRAFHARLDAALGAPTEDGSLQDRLARFDAALIQATADPASPVLLEGVIRDAAALTRKVRDMADLVTEERNLAERRIADTVASVNADLRTVSDLNADIMRLQVRGHDSADLLDRRDLLIDRISQAVPVRTLARDHGTVALVTGGGVMLLDGRPAELSFTPRALVTPEMELGAGLDGLRVNGREVVFADDRSRIAGGAMAALFALRDEVAPQAMTRLDAFAGELVTRFAASAADPTLGPGDPGLFTDAGGPADFATPGLGARLQLNGLVDADDPSTFFRVQSGLGAAGPDPSGDSAQLLRLTSELRRPALPVSGALGSRSVDLVGLAADLRGRVSADRVRSEDAAAIATASADAAVARRDGGAVDIDAEMRRLIEVEQAYAANARVLQVTGEMIKRLTEI